MEFIFMTLTALILQNNVANSQDQFNNLFFQNSNQEIQSNGNLNFNAQNFGQTQQNFLPNNGFVPININTNNYAQNHNTPLVENSNGNSVFTSGANNIPPGSSTIVGSENNGGDEEFKMAYKNVGYGNYKASSEESSASPATPEEIEASYKQSVINLKSQNGRVEVQHDPTLSEFQNILGNQGQSFQQFEATPTFQPFKPDVSNLQADIQNFQSFQGVQNFPSTHSDIQNFQNFQSQIQGLQNFQQIHSPIITHENAGIQNFPSFQNILHHQTPIVDPNFFKQTQFPDQPSGNGQPYLHPTIIPTKGSVENIPISVQQLQQGFSVDVHYPPKISNNHHEAIDGLNFLSKPRELNYFTASDAKLDLKSDFRPSEPDHSHFPSATPHFSPPAMSSGFKPSFGPFGSPTLVEASPQLSIPQFPLGLPQPTPHSPIIDHHNDHHEHQHQHQQHPGYQFSTSFAGADIPTSYQHVHKDYEAQTHEVPINYVHPTNNPSTEYKFIFVKGPQAMENDHNEKAMAYLSYLAQSATENAKVTLPDKSSLSLPESSKFLYFPSNKKSLKGTEKSHPNSFDQLFPMVRTKSGRRRQKKKKKPFYTLKRGTTTRRRKKKGNNKALLQRGSTDSHHRLAKIIRNKKAGYKMFTFPPFPKKASPYTSDLQEMFKAYGLNPTHGLDIGGNGPESEKFTRSTKNSSKKKSTKEESEEESSEEDEDIEEDKKSSSRKVPIKKSPKKDKVTTTETPTTVPSTTMSTSTTTTPSTTTAPPTSPTTTTTETPKTTTSSPTTTTTSPTTTTSVPTSTTTTIASTTEVPSSSTTTTPTTTTTEPTTTENTTTTTTTTPKPTTTSTSKSVHLTISVLPKKYDIEATSESRRSSSEKLKEANKKQGPDEYSSSEETYDESLSNEVNEESEDNTSEESVLKTNGHQLKPVQTENGDSSSNVVIPIYFESSKMSESEPDAEEEESSNEYGNEDAMMEMMNEGNEASSSTAKKDLSSSSKGTEKTKAKGKKSRRKIKASLARQLKGKKRIQKVKRPNKRNGRRHEPT